MNTHCRNFSYFSLVRKSFVSAGHFKKTSISVDARWQRFQAGPSVIQAHDETKSRLPLYHLKLAEVLAGAMSAW